MVIELKHLSGEEEKDVQSRLSEDSHGGVVWDPDMPKEALIALQNLFTDEEQRDAPEICLRVVLQQAYDQQPQNQLQAPTQ